MNALLRPKVVCQLFGDDERSARAADKERPARPAPRPARGCAIMAPRRLMAPRARPLHAVAVEVHEQSDGPAASPRRSAAVSAPGCRPTLPPPPRPRTKWTRRVRHPVLIGHAASLSQVAAESFAQRDGVPLRDARGAPLIDYQAAAPPGPPRSVCRRCAEPRGGPMRRAVRGRNRLVSFRLVAWRLLTRTKPTVFVSPRGVAAVDEDETGCFRFASWRGGC